MNDPYTFENIEKPSMIGTVLFAYISTFLSALLLYLIVFVFSVPFAISLVKFLTGLSVFAFFGFNIFMVIQKEFRNQIMIKAHLGNAKAKDYIVELARITKTPWIWPTRLIELFLFIAYIYVMLMWNMPIWAAVYALIGLSQFVILWMNKQSIKQDALNV